MTRRRRAPRPLEFTLRFYPGQDDDLVRWLDELEEQMGAKTQAMKDALRKGMRTDSLQATALAPELDMVEVRRVVEAASASALGRFEGQVVGAAATASAEEDDDDDDEVDVRRIGGDLEELIMKANASVLEGWELDQLFKLRERQPDLLEPVVKRLVQENEDIRWSVVVGAYEDRQINLGKAAELLGVTELELRQRFIELGIPLRVGPADLAEARAEVEAVRAWFADEADEGRS